MSRFVTHFVNFWLFRVFSTFCHFLTFLAFLVSHPLERSGEFSRRFSRVWCLEISGLVVPCRFYGFCENSRFWTKLSFLVSRLVFETLLNLRLNCVIWYDHFARNEPSGLAYTGSLFEWSEMFKIPCHSGDPVFVKSQILKPTKRKGKVVTHFERFCLFLDDKYLDGVIDLARKNEMVLR